MENKGYIFKEDYIRTVVLNCRRVCDERGLSELQRRRYNYQMFNYMYILDDLMPLHRQEYDFSHLEVNSLVYTLYTISTFTTPVCTCIYMYMYVRSFLLQKCQLSVWIYERNPQCNHSKHSRQNFAGYYLQHRISLSNTHEHAQQTMWSASSVYCVICLTTPTYLHK